jgi:hypothetical protein
VGLLNRGMDDRTVQGALLYDREMGGWTIAAGSRSAAYFYLGSGESVVLVDSPVEAISVAAVACDCVAGKKLESGFAG